MARGCSAKVIEGDVEPFVDVAMNLVIFIANLQLLIFINLQLFVARGKKPLLKRRHRLGSHSYTYF